MQFGINKHEKIFFQDDQNCTSPMGLCNLSSLKKLTSAYLFQIAREYTIMKKFEMGKQKKCTRITQSGKNCPIIAPSRAHAWFENKDLIGYLWTSLFIDQSECLFCIQLPLFCTVLRKNCTVLSQSELSNFFIYIIRQ